MKCPTLNRALFPLKIVLFCWYGGRGSGSFAGGTMMSQFGARLAFRVMGIASGAMLLVYGAVYYGWLRRTEMRNKKKLEAQNEVELHGCSALSNNTTDAVNCIHEVSQNQIQSNCDPALSNGHHQTEEGVTHSEVAVAEDSEQT